MSVVKQLVSMRSLMALLGYALYRGVAYNSYTTGFSLADGQVGYIFNLTFLAAASVGLIGTALPLGIHYWRTSYRPLTIGYAVPAGALLVCYAFSWAGAPLLDERLVLALLGLFWGAATMVLTIAWLEILALNSSPLVLAFQLAFASLLSALVGLLLPANLDPVNSILCCLLLVASMLLLHFCRQKTMPFEPLPEKTVTKQVLRQALIPIVGCLLFEMIIGMFNMYVVTSHSVSLITADTPLQGMALCAILIFLFVFITTRVPNPSIIYLIVFPVMIAAFLLLPFFGDSFGPQISQLFYAGYLFTTLIALLYYLRSGVAFRGNLYFILAFLGGMTRVALIIGLGLGSLFGNLRQGDDVMHLTFIAVICVYLLGTAVVVWSLNSAREARMKERGLFESSAEEPVTAGAAVDRPDAKWGTREAAKRDAAETTHSTEGLEDALRIRIEELRERYRFTPRECDVLARLAMGYSAATIAEELVVATSTVNGYVKSIYVKLGVNRKQQVIDLFNDILVAPEPFKLIR